MGARLCGRGIALLALSLTATLGCDRGPQRLSISGSVNVDGQPLDFGSITFVPEVTGPKASATIEDGKYTIESSRGPLAGSKTVEIRAPRYAPDKPAPTTSAQKLRQMAVAPERLPARYNSKSELQANVTNDGPNEFNFELQSDRK